MSHDRAHLERTVRDFLVLDGRGSATVPPAGPAAGRDFWSQMPRRGGVREQKSEGPKRRPTPLVPPAGPGPGRPRKPRSPGTLRRLLDQAQAELAEAADARDRLAAELGAERDHTVLARLAEALAQAESRLAAAEERWLAVAEEMEAR